MKRNDDAFKKILDSLPTEVHPLDSGHIRQRAEFEVGVKKDAEKLGEVKSDTRVLH